LEGCGLGQEEAAGEVDLHDAVKGLGRVGEEVTEEGDACVGDGDVYSAEGGYCLPGEVPDEVDVCDVSGKGEAMRAELFGGIFGKGRIPVVKDYAGALRDKPAAYFETNALAGARDYRYFVFHNA